MTTLYRPVLIESAEQAEALPIGSVSPPSHHDDKPAVKITEVLWVSVWDVDDGHDLTYDVAPNSHMVNDLVLVPIEAETDRLYPAGATLKNYDVPTHTRLVTPWEEA